MFTLDGRQRFRSLSLFNRNNFAKICCLTIGITAITACAPPAPPPPDYAKADALVAGDREDCIASMRDRVDFAICFAKARQNRYSQVGSDASLLSLIGQIDAYRIEQYRRDIRLEEANFLVDQYINQIIAQGEAAAAERERQQQQAASLALLQMGQAIQQRQRTPSTTNCRWIGVNWVCNSY